MQASNLISVAGPMTRYLRSTDQEKDQTFYRQSNHCLSQSYQADLAEALLAPWKLA